jgi:hypothetical protein
MAGPTDSASSDEKVSPVEHYANKLDAQTSAAERQERMAAALAIDPGHKAWTWPAIQTVLITLCVCCCSGDSGFDGTVMGGINAMKYVPSPSFPQTALTTCS